MLIKQPSRILVCGLWLAFYLILHANLGSPVPRWTMVLNISKGNYGNPAVEPVWLVNRSRFVTSREGYGSTWLINHRVRPPQQGIWSLDALGCEGQMQQTHLHIFPPAPHRRSAWTLLCNAEDLWSLRCVISAILSRTFFFT